MTDIVPRGQWADRPAARTPARISLPTPRLWLHHGGAGTSTVATARSYLRHHVVTRGWADIGYSYLIAAGQVLEGRGAGRAGAHTAGDNSFSHGICMVGDYTSRPPADRDLDALVWLVRYGHDRGWWPGRLTGGHRDAPGATTACPGAALYRLIPELNRRVTAAPQEDDQMPLLTRIDGSDAVYQIVGHALVHVHSGKQAQAIARLAGWSGRWQDHVGDLTKAEAAEFIEIRNLTADPLDVDRVVVDVLDQADGRYVRHGQPITIEPG